MLYRHSTQTKSKERAGDMESLHSFNIEWAKLLQIKLFEEIKNDKEMDHVYDILQENYVMYSKSIGKFDFPPLF